MLFIIAILVLATNLSYFVVFADMPNRIFSLISEVLFYAFTIIGFFGILYHFIKDQSRQLIMVIFFCSIIPISLLIGWVNAKIDIRSVSNEAKSRILLKSNKAVSAKILRSFEKGMFVIIGSNTGVNFISWDEIKEVKFKKVSGL